MLKKVFLLALGILLLNTQIVAAKSGTTEKYSEELYDSHGQKVTVNIIPGIKKSERKAGRIVSPSELKGKGINYIADIPVFDWSHGCAPTAAAMMAAYYDRNGYENIYTGPTNDGVMPLTNEIWGEKKCPLSATEQGIDGLSEAGHVNNFYQFEGVSGPMFADPFGTGDPTGTYQNCLADYMGTSQDWWNNKDGWTTYVAFDNGTAYHDYTGLENSTTKRRDLAHGIKEFFDSRGYVIEINYNQYITEQTTSNNGFTFEQFKNEIDNNHPTLLHLVGHTMLAAGYKEADGTGDNKDSVYVHDTWNHDVHIMAWNGTYSEAQHKAMTVINLRSMPMELVYDTNLETGTQITLPLYGAVDVTVDWGDGSSEDFAYSANISGGGTSGLKSHTYDAEDNYTVKIYGSLEQFGRANYSYDNAKKLVSVSDFGEIGLSSLAGAFSKAENLTSVPTLLPETLTSLQRTFYYAKNFNFDISSWNVVNITNMRDMFNEADAFTGNIGNWNVSNVETMQTMFYGANAFNTDISSWNVGKVENMRSMFDGAASFNQNVGNWNISNVTTMLSMFYGVTLSTSNYDAILNGWSAQSVQSGVSFNGGNSKYSSAALAARNILTGEPNNWSISDGGMVAALPAVTTQAVTDITETSATGNGTVTAINGANITERGVYWSLTNGFADGEGTKVSENGNWTEGVFTSNMTGLTIGNPYFVKAFATNSAGTSYGEQVSFTPAAITPPGNALEFNVSAEYVDMGNNVILNGNFTQEMWVSISPDMAGWNALITPSAGVRSPFVYATSSSDASAIIYGFDFADKGAVQAVVGGLKVNTWMHIAITFDGANYKCYINGIEKTNNTAINGHTPSSTPIKYLAQSFGNGEVDELKMWSVARTTEEIQSGMKQTLSGDETGLVVYYRCDATSGNSLIDISPNGNNGTLMNMADANWIASDAMQLPQTAFAGSDEGDNFFTANWAINYTATKYLLDVSTVNDFSSFVAGYENKEIADENANSQVVTGLAGETTYYYRVRAFNEFTGKTSANSAVIAITTIADTQTPVVTAGAGQIVETSGTNSAIVQSNEIGTVYIVLETVDPQITVEDFEAALAIGLAAKASITEINTDTGIMVAGISNGFYYAYAVDASGNISAKGTNAIQIIYPNGIDSVVPEITELIGNYPNPFNPETTIKFNIASDSNVKISIFNYKGELVQELVNKFQPAGKYSVKWNGSNATSGIYFYKMTAGKYTRIKRAVMVK